MTDLDQRLARMVGWTYTEDENIGSGIVRQWSNSAKGLYLAHTPPAYSTDISAGFQELLPWLNGNGWYLGSLRQEDVWYNGPDGSGRWSAVMINKKARCTRSGFADTPAMAIALVADAVGR